MMTFLGEQLKGRFCFCLNYIFYDILANRVPPISTQMVVNRVDTARHGLILCEHGATAYTELLEAYCGEYQSIFNVFLMRILVFADTWVAEIDFPSTTNCF